MRDVDLLRRGGPWGGGGTNIGSAARRMRVQRSNEYCPRCCSGQLAVQRRYGVATGSSEEGGGWQEGGGGWQEGDAPTVDLWHVPSGVRIRDSPVRPDRFDVHLLFAMQGT